MELRCPRRVNIYYKGVATISDTLHSPLKIHISSRAHFLPPGRFSLTVVVRLSIWDECLETFWVWTDLFYLHLPAVGQHTFTDAYCVLGTGLDEENRQPTPHQSTV